MRGSSTRYILQRSARSALTLAIPAATTTKLTFDAPRQLWCKQTHVSTVVNVLAVRNSYINTHTRV